ncbi:hypothetical protein Glove_23g228 [Diversispora epigaea]|uniref:Aconitase/3-isopropylmalate dehydratase large subunit alpha/beta/alpha domain-containing protein n=1 Tax=Diversispora epigaea TaxID=1348612 RepID=A0A397JT50_9GLOM|nr:hypothetical protein Glove_23g228 [Diversispora epigaea]
MNGGRFERTKILSLEKRNIYEWKNKFPFSTPLDPPAPKDEYQAAIDKAKSAEYTKKARRAAYVTVEHIQQTRRRKQRLRLSKRAKGYSPYISSPLYDRSEKKPYYNNEYKKYVFGQKEEMMGSCNNVHALEPDNEDIDVVVNTDWKPDTHYTEARKDSGKDVAVVRELCNIRLELSYTELGMIAIGVGGADAVDATVSQYSWCKIKGELNEWKMHLVGKLTGRGGMGYIIEHLGQGIEKLFCTGMSTICNENIGNITTTRKRDNTTVYMGTLILSSTADIIQSYYTIAQEDRMIDKFSNLSVGVGGGGGGVRITNSKDIPEISDLRHSCIIMFSVFYLLLYQCNFKTLLHNYVFDILPIAISKMQLWYQITHPLNVICYTSDN